MTTTAALVGGGPACAGTDTETWFSTVPADQVVCLRICADCPVREACLAGALARDEQWGIWGGRIFTPRFVTAAVDDVAGRWMVRGLTRDGVQLGRGWFKRREDAEALLVELMADSADRARCAETAPGWRKGPHWFTDADAA
ncbi:WhiB family transcriptional regulator [Microlunatus ginsengisoli]|uniref:4Fe-4S Wbl-type domain-containing protein n=1 Tax=Microlunatus ginsengisoli TaxID=363863 RepID=A0ABP6ZKD8_9ACTN